MRFLFKSRGRRSDFWTVLGEMHFKVQLRFNQNLKHEFDSRPHRRLRLTPNTGHAFVGLTQYALSDWKVQFPEGPNPTILKQILCDLVQARKAFVNHLSHGLMGYCLTILLGPQARIPNRLRWRPQHLPRNCNKDTHDSLISNLAWTLCKTQFHRIQTRLPPNSSCESRCKTGKRFYGL